MLQTGCRADSQDSTPLVPTTRGYMSCLLPGPAWIITAVRALLRLCNREWGMEEGLALWVGRVHDCEFKSLLWKRMKVTRSSEVEKLMRIWFKKSHISRGENKSSDPPGWWAGRGSPSPSWLEGSAVIHKAGLRILTCHVSPFLLLKLRFSIKIFL